ncbi:MAG: hypothetical protein HUJ54_00890, partial [Erysipelotrichaceae bacterium]|nr:hypothetical protein [Erysipelotrichaceae bacterium]
MNFWEKYGTLVAMSLCGVSLIPTASLASAQEELEGNQDRETIEASKDTAISWKEVQPVPYYEEEEVCIQPQAAALAEEAKNVETAAEEAAADEVTVEAVREEKAPVMAAPEDAVEIAAVEIAAVEIAAVEQEAPAAVYDVPVFSDYAVQAAAETVEEQPEAFAQETVPAQAEVSVPVWDAAPAPEAETSAPVWEAAPAPEAEASAPV